MSLETLLIENSPWIFLVYILLKEGMPILRSIADKIVPERIAKAKSTEERRIEVMERETDLREREVLTFEGINKSLVVLETIMRQHTVETQLVMAGLNTANQTLALLLDRNYQRRKGDDAHTS